MSRLSKATTLPVEWAPAFKDPADSRVEAVALSLFTVVGSAVRPTLAGSLVAQTLTERAKLLLQELEDQGAFESSRDLAEQFGSGSKISLQGGRGYDTFAFCAAVRIKAVVPPKTNF